MPSKLGLFSVSLLSLCASAGIGSEACAQTADAGNEAKSVIWNDIVVTARRREESAQTVPVSIAAFGTEELERRSVESLEDLTRVTPGLRYAAEGGAQNTIVSIRGLSKIPLGDGTPAVVTYFSDIPMTSTGTNIPTFDLASIQVLKGPQGTLFGRNTIGGAVLVTPAAPEFRFGGYVNATFGEYNYRAFEGALNLPVVQDKVAVRLSGQVRDRDGFVENLGIGPDFEDLNQYALRGSLLIEPSSRLRNTLIVDYFKADEAPSASILYGIKPAILNAFDRAFRGATVFGAFIPDLNAQFAAQQARGIRVTDSDLPTPTYQRELLGITNRTEFVLSDNVTIKNIFGYRTTDQLYSANTDGLPLLTTATPFDAAPLFGSPVPVPLDRLTLFNGGVAINSKQLSDEIQLLGTSLAGKLNWIVGAFYSKEQPRGPQGSFTQTFDLQSSTTGIHLSVPATNVTHQTTTSRAVFAQIGLDVSEWTFDGLKLNLGVRYTWDKIELCAGNVLQTTPPFVFDSTKAPYLDLDACLDRSSLSPTDGFGNLKTKSDAPTWTIGLDYQITPDIFTYIVTRRGYRQAGISAPAFETPCTTGGACVGAPGSDLRPFQYTRPEEVTDVEAGLKADWNVGDVSGRFNISAFYMKYKDAVQFINTAGVIPSNDGGTPTRGSFGLNAADLTIKGAELEASIAPFKSLLLSVTGSYIDQKVDQIGNVPAPFTLIPSQVTLPTPKLSGTVGFEWTLPFHPANGDVTLSGDYFLTKGYQAQASFLPGYDVANFRLSWDNIGGQPIKASVFVTNAFDEEYIQSPVIALNTFPINVGLYGPPRIWGLELNYKFGN